MGTKEVMMGKQKKDYVMEDVMGSWEGNRKGVKNGGKEQIYKGEKRARTTEGGKKEWKKYGTRGGRKRSKVMKEEDELEGRRRRK